MSDETDFTCSHRIDETVAFAGMLQDFARDRSPVYGVDDASVGRVDEMLAVKLEVAYVGEARVVALPSGMRR